MTRIQKSAFHEEDEAVLSIVATLAHHFRKEPLYKRIGRFRNFSNPNRMHTENIRTVIHHATKIKNGALLSAFAVHARNLIKKS